MMDLAEGVGESSSPPRSFAGYDVRSDVYNRLIESGNVEAADNPEFRELLDVHFSRLPSRFGYLIFKKVFLYILFNEG